MRAIRRSSRCAITRCSLTSRSATAGKNAGPTSKEYLLAALGACAAITMKMYAERKNWPFEGVEIDLSTERYNTAEYPAYQGEESFVHEFRQRIVFTKAR